MFPLKRLEHSLLEIPAHTDPGIADHKFKRRVAGRRVQSPGDFQPDPPLGRRVFHRVAEEIQEKLRHPEPVAQDVARYIPGQPDLILVPVGEDLGLHQVRHLIDDIPQAHPGLLKRHSSALNAAHVQNVIDQAQQMNAGCPYFAEAVDDFFPVVDMLCGNVREADDRVHGSPYVMGHI